MARSGPREVVVEVRSVNRRGLEVQVDVARVLTGVEDLVQEQVRAVAQRGRVSVEVRVGGPAVAVVLDWDDAAVDAAVVRLRELAGRQGIAFAPTAELLLELAVRHPRTAADAGTADWLPLVESALAEALAAWRGMQAEEGAALSRDLRARVAVIEAALDAMVPELAAVPVAAREALLQRLRQAGLGIDPSDERVLKELALYADRSDVSEEVTRLRSHFAQFVETLGSRDAAGRRLEFLLQEVQREVNTLGSKTPSVAVTRRVVEMKTEIERIREQLANVE